MINTKFGENIKKIRENNDISQQRLALMLGVDRTTVSHWENNLNEPSLNILIMISKMFDITYEDLLL